MSDAITLIFNFFISIFYMLNGVSFTLFGINVSYMGIIIGFLITGIIVSVFWRGART